MPLGRYKNGNALFEKHSPTIWHSSALLILKDFFDLVIRSLLVKLLKKLLFFFN